MKLIDWILVAAVVIGLILAIRHMIKNKGGCSCGGSCSGNCSSCTNACADKHKH